VLRLEGAECGSNGAVLPSGILHTTFPAPICAVLPLTDTGQSKLARATAATASTSLSTAAVQPPKLAEPRDSSAAAPPSADGRPTQLVAELCTLGVLSVLVVCGNGQLFAYSYNESSGCWSAGDSAQLPQLTAETLAAQVAGQQMIPVPAAMPATVMPSMAESSLTASAAAASSALPVSSSLGMPAGMPLCRRLAVRDATYEPQSRMLVWCDEVQADATTCFVLACTLTVSWGKFEFSNFRTILLACPRMRLRALSSAAVVMHCELLSNTATSGTATATAEPDVPSAPITPLDQCTLERRLVHIINCDNGKLRTLVHGRGCVPEAVLGVLSLQVRALRG
jgi:hypothetical protein